MCLDADRAGVVFFQLKVAFLIGDHNEIGNFVYDTENTENTENFCRS